MLVCTFNKEKTLVGAFSLITNLRMEIFEARISTVFDVLRPPGLHQHLQLLHHGLARPAQRQPPHPAATALEPASYEHAQLAPQLGHVATLAWW